MITAALLTLSLMATAPGEPAPENVAEPAAESAAERSEFAQACADEVEGLHQFFHDWFVGELPDTDEAYARFADALAPEFIIISPSGRVSRRDGLLESLRGAHGSGKETGVKIWIRGFDVRFEQGDLAIVNYEEWQQRRGSKTGRVSTAMLQRDPEAPGGVRWLHLHETWLPSSQIEASQDSP
ncbi:MAG: DUF4440 domain-containing protein [Acidobacteriota bacterium]